MAMDSLIAASLETGAQNGPTLGENQLPQKSTLIAPKGKPNAVPSGQLSVAMQMTTYIMHTAIHQPGADKIHWQSPSQSPMEAATIVQIQMAQRLTLLEAGRQE
jgi:hypothetical protein